MYSIKNARAVHAYGMAVLAVAGAVLARFAVDPIAHDKSPFLFSAFAVMVAALYGDLRSGIAATVLSVMAADYLFVEPRYTLFTHDAAGDSTMLASFAILGVLLSIIVEKLHRLHGRLKNANTLLLDRGRELETANERFRMAVETAEEAIWEMEPQAHTGSWDALYAKQFGRRPTDSSLEWWFDHIHPDDRGRVQASFIKAIEGDATTWRAEYRMQRADESWASVYDRASIARDDKGAGVHVTGAMLDVTDMRRTEAELERRTAELARSNEDLKRFAYAVSHDLRAPLRMIGDYTRRLANPEVIEDRERLSGALLDGIARMNKIIEDLLELALVSSQTTPSRTCTDAGVIAGLALQHLRVEIQETGAQVAVDPLPTVVVNETQLLRVFQNLIGNALKYCTDTPIVHVFARREDDVWVFAVEDNGIGIAPEYRERVFGLFERLQPQGTRSGTGIGLAIVKRIVSAQGGRVWVESRPGSGSIFYFTLPAADVPAEQSGTDTHSAFSGSN